MKISSYITTAHGRDKAYKAVRDSREGKWVTIILTLITTVGGIVALDHQAANDRAANKQQFEQWKQESDRHRKAQDAINVEAIGSKREVATISAEATNTVKQMKEIK